MADIKIEKRGAYIFFGTTGVPVQSVWWKEGETTVSAYRTNSNEQIIKDRPYTEIIKANGDRVTDKADFRAYQENFELGSSEIGLGWAQYGDTQYNDSNRLTLTASTDNPIPNNAGSSITSYLPKGITSLYDGNVITPAQIGDAYVLRVNFTATISNNNGSCEIKLDIGGLKGDILERTLKFPRGAGVAHRFTNTNLIYSLSTFLDNGGQVQISPSHTMEIWDITFVIARVYKA